MRDDEGQTVAIDSTISTAGPTRRKSRVCGSAAYRGALGGTIITNHRLDSFHRARLPWGACHEELRAMDNCQSATVVKKGHAR